MKYRRYKIFLLFFILAIALGAPFNSFADWNSDEAYIKQLEKRVNELEEVVEQFGKYLRSLDMVEAEVSNLQLPLADPQSDPEKLIRQFLFSSYPRLKIKLQKLSAHAPEGVEIWRWHCILTGPAEEMRWATGLLRQKGLFIMPSTSEPMVLSLDPSQQTGTLSFVAHHIRLNINSVPKIPPPTKGSDAMANRKDPLADRIKELRTEIETLRNRMIGVIGFEIRIDAVQILITHLSHLIRSSDHPFRPITPLLDLDLIQFKTISHTGTRVVLVGETPSETTRRAAVLWFKKHRKIKPSYKLESLVIKYPKANPKVLEINASKSSKGEPRCELFFAQAQGIDFAVANEMKGALVSFGPPTSGISGRLKNISLARTLPNLVEEAHLTLLHDGPNVLLVPKGGKPVAEACLKKSTPSTGESKKLRTLSLTLSYGNVLRVLQKNQPEVIKAPADFWEDIMPVVAIGRAPLLQWVRLLGAAQGLSVKSAKNELSLLLPSVDTTSKSKESKTKEPAKKERQSKENENPLVVAPHLKEEVELNDIPEGYGAPLAALAVRVVSICPGRSWAVISSPRSVPLKVTKGKLIGRGRNKVLAVHRQGITLQWTNDKVKARVNLPLAFPKATNSQALPRQNKKEAR